MMIKTAVQNIQSDVINISLGNSTNAVKLVVFTPADVW